MTVIKHSRGKISHFLSEEPKKIMNDSKEREISQGASCNQQWNQHTLLGQENVIDSGAVACGVVAALCFRPFSEHFSTNFRWFKISVACKMKLLEGFSLTCWKRCPTAY